MHMSGFMLSALALTGCGEDLKLTVTPVKNVESVQVTDLNQLDVYCQTGICQFDVTANQRANITVNMHYSGSRAFEKIEGVSVTGKLGSSVVMVDENTFTLDISGEPEPSKLLVVDYYR
ncbi:spore gernimation protein [Photobacterium proteolyticum]|uniref:Spore gernimation protein n=2 Tax=Photobacterium proteolyticum TaxID=1903952 RepID=A0A1Q9GBI9_9GAMM|nr:spore gernimation protein [Photobacterium proteolyticum]